MANPSLVVKGVQHLLAAYDLARPVRVDGVIGPETRAAYAAAAPNTVAVVNGYVSQRDASVLALLRQENQLKDGTWIDSAALDQYIRVAVGRAGHLAPGVNDKEGYLRMLVREEAARANRGGQELFLVESVRGSFRGLTQFDATTWNAVRSKRNFQDMLPPYREGSFEPISSLIAALLLAQLNHEFLIASLVKGKERSGSNLRLSHAMLYGAHNQGGPGFLRLIKGGGFEGGQSPSAKSLILAAAKEARSFT